MCESGPDVLVEMVCKQYDKISGIEVVHAVGDLLIEQTAIVCKMFGGG